MPNKMKTFEEYKEEKWPLHENFNLDHNPCELCGGLCCVGLYLDQGPVLEHSHDAMRWAKFHEGVEIYMAEQQGVMRWGVKIPTLRCEHLTEEGKCAIQDEKPKGCSQYFGLNPDGPFLECNLIRELIKTKQIAYKEMWLEKLWPDGLPKELLSD